MRILIDATGFSTWAGGIDFLRYIANALESVRDEGEGCELHLFVPGFDLLTRGRARLAWLKRVLLSRLHGDGNAPSFQKGLSTEAILSVFAGVVEPSNVLFGSLRCRTGAQAVRKIGADVVLPRLFPDAEAPIPQVGYLFDFQHRYLPHFFTEAEARDRDEHFARTAAHSDVLLVNSRAARGDCMRYLAVVPEVFALPFAPYPRAEWVNEEYDCREKYGLERPYFIVCNQFWKHKNHTVVIEAMRHLIGKNDVDLVCTGDTADFRFPDYFATGILEPIRRGGLESRIRILGFISKRDQIALMKQALAVIQPTLFEGGPGGGAAYDAIALGKPLLLSDIPINREITIGDVEFFTPDDAPALADLMRKRATAGPANDLERDTLLAAGKLRQQTCGRAVLQAIEAACARHSGRAGRL